MKILKLIAENVMRLKVVEITPNGNLIIIGGDNEQGKTSVLDSIEMAFGGINKKKIPRPVRSGTKKAEIVAELDGLTVRRTITSSGGGGLTVSDDTGKLGSPQAILDSLLGSLSFDPLAFSRMDGRKQAEQLRELVGLDFTEIDAERKALLEERAEANREVKRIKGSLDSLVHHEDIGPVVKVSELLSQIDELKAKNAKNGEVEAECFQVETEHTRAVTKLQEVEASVRELEDELKRAEEKLRYARDEILNAKDSVEEHLKERRAAEAKLDALTWHGDEIKAISKQISEAEDANAKARDNERYADTTSELAGTESAHRKLESELRRLDEKREELLAAAKFPLEGLGFDENGVTLKGIPFSQASASEALKTSLAMGLAVNKKIKVILIRDGSLLDSESLKTVAEMAEAADAQVWMERVGKGEECSVIIEDGTVKEAPICVACKGVGNLEGSPGPCPECKGTGREVWKDPDPLPDPARAAEAEANSLAWRDEHPAEDAGNE